jgi:hypothetical protein
VTAASLIGFALAAAPLQAAAGGQAQAAPERVSKAPTAQQAVLIRCAREAVTRLARDGGFSRDPEVRFGPPPALREADKILRLLGARKEADRFQLVLNQTAETLAGKAEPLILAAIREPDPTGPAASDHGQGVELAPLTSGFRHAHEAELLVKLTPMAQELTQGTLLSRVYLRVVKQTTRYGFMRGEAPPLDRYLAQQTLNGLFTAMSDAERTPDQDRAASKAAGK